MRPPGLCPRSATCWLCTWGQSVTSLCLGFLIRTMGTAVIIVSQCEGLRTVSGAFMLLVYVITTGRVLGTQ